MEERHKAVNQKYKQAREALVAYKNTAGPLYQAPLEVFIKELDAIHTQKNLPEAVLITAFEKTDALMRGKISSAEYMQVIHEMKARKHASCEPSRLSQAMETLSWAIWIISLACILTGPIILGMLGMFLSVAIYNDAQHSEVKYPYTDNTRFNLTPIVEQMEKIQNLDECGVPEATMHI